MKYLMVFILSYSYVCADIVLPNAPDSAEQIKIQQDLKRLQDQELQRLQDQQKQLNDQNILKPNVSLEQPPLQPSGPLPVDEKPCFVLKKIELVGEQAARFSSAIKAAQTPDNPMDKCIGGQGLNTIMVRIQNEVMARGYVTTRVLAQPQDFSQGTFQLTIIPGLVATIAGDDAIKRNTFWQFLDEETQQYYDQALSNTDRANFGNAFPTHPGKLLNIRDIEQGLENLKRVPTVEADIQIRPSSLKDKDNGLSDLVIKWKQDKRWRFSANLDDSGSDATGKYQANITASSDHSFLANDLFYVTMTHDVDGDASHGTSGFNWHYSVPWGYGLFTYAGGNSDYYQKVQGLNQVYQYSGTSSNQSLTLQRMVYRDAQRKISLSLAGWQRESQNYIDDTEVGVQHRRVAGWELIASHNDMFGALSWDMNWRWKQGTGALNSLQAPEENFNEGTARFKLLSADLRISYPFQLKNYRLRYDNSVRAQWHKSLLTPQDRFAIGGRFSVRGFDGESSLSAETGWTTRNELSCSFKPMWPEVYLALDYGHVRGPSADVLPGQSLLGTALGLRGAYKKFSYDTFIGAPVQKPEKFKTASASGGFSLGYKF